jgi:hypothetical protein
MAIKLMKDITRETLAVTDHKNQPQIVTLKAGDLLEFRAKGRRYRFEVPLAACYNLALIYTHQQIYKEKLIEYDKCKKTGMKKRRPKPLPRIFNQAMYEALKMN